MKINADIVHQTAQYVSTTLNNKLPETYCYHNLSHAINIVNAVNEIAEGMKLANHDRYILITAGWLHDLGYIWKIEGHEMEAAGIAETFLEERKIDAEDIELVKGCIMATKYPQNPSTVLQQVICDADLRHLGEKEFFEKTALMREEWSITREQYYTDQEWHELNLTFLKKHSFHTLYCKAHFDKRKKKNIKHLERLLREERQNLILPETIRRLV